MTHPAPAKPLIKPDDIFFLLARHKWKLAIALATGVLLGAVLWFTQVPSYVSEARVMVRYVMETRSLGPVSGVRQIKDTDQGAASVLNSELQIVTSQDLMSKVVAEVGAKRIAPAAGTNSGAAIAAVIKGLTVQVPTRSDVILLNFRHSDPEVARDVLNGLIKAYLAKHKEIHHSADSFDFLQEQTDSMRTRLGLTEDELRKLKSEAGIVSLEAAKIEIPARISSLRKSVLDVESELAEAIARTTKGNPTNGSSANAAQTAPAPSTNELAAVQSPLPSSPQLLTERAAQLRQKIAALKSRQSDLLVSFTPESKPVQQLDRQMKDLQHELDSIDPADLAAESETHRTFARTPGMPPMSISSFDPARIYGLQAKYRLLTNQLAAAVQDSKKFESLEDRIRNLERRRELEENQYKYFYTGLEQSKIDNALDTGKINNISIVQSPSFGYRSKENLIKAGGAAVVPLILVLAFVLLTGLIFPKSYARAREVEASLNIPVLVSIPHYGVNGHSRLRLPGTAPHGRRKLSLQTKNAQTEPLATSDSSDASDPPAEHPVADSTGWMNSEIPPWDPNDPMLEYYEALRDRVVMSYSGDLHKPKIIGLTSTNRGAGVSRIATGLAAALSRDVERTVLYISLEKNKVAVSAFDKGRPAENLPVAETAAEESKALVQKNLYSLATVGRGVTGAGIVQTFSDLMPRLKATDYDYIVFDLPPITQTSGSLRLAAQLERTFLVIEAEKSSREFLDKAKKLLNHPHLGAIFNKANSCGSDSLAG